MASWLSTHAPKRFDELAVPQSIRDQFIRASSSGDPPHLLITGPAGVGKTAAWRLVARQVLGPGWKSTSHILQARDLSRQAGAMKTFEEFLRPAGLDSSDTLASRTSLDAFDRNMWAGDVGEAPCGEETQVEFGRAPVSRLIIIEDADHLGSRRQPYLRRMMESESHTTRFIFTARAPSRIIDALRSRMQHIRIPPIPSEEIAATVRKVTSLEDVTMAEGMAEEAAARENEYLDLFNLTPPFWFAGEVPDETEWGGDSSELPNRKVIQGMGGSAGVATGRARVILDPTNPGKLEPGDILVAPITDPSWTPLFVPASAVVVDVGATMSHAVIVSRELGIPCVVSATGATSRIPDGAHIKVNGDTGTVTILS